LSIDKFEIFKIYANIIIIIKLDYSRVEVAVDTRRRGWKRNTKL